MAWNAHGTGLPGEGDYRYLPGKRDRIVPERPLCTNPAAPEARLYNSYFTLRYNPFGRCFILKRGAFVNFVPRNMKPGRENIHPIFDRILQRRDKEELLHQHAKVIWLTGLSGSGKSTLARHIERLLHAKGFVTMLLDGDNIRAGINNNLGFSAEDRKENIRRIAEVSKLFLHCGIITLNSFVSPTRAIRKMAGDIIGVEDFVEIYVNAPLEVCEARDVKGLYKKARAGLIPDFTGITAPFEAPENPSLEIRTDQMDEESSVQMLLRCILPMITKE